MKKQFVLYLLIIFGFAKCNTFNQKSSSDNHSKTITVVTDITNKRLIWPDALAILSSFHCDVDLNASCRLNLMAITDKRINPVFSCSLADFMTTERENRNDDPEFRKQSILNFYQEVRNLYASFFKTFDTAKDLNHSEIWATICDALKGLIQDSSKSKKLFVYSDLLEKSNYGNAYTNLVNQPVSVIAESFDNTGLMPRDLNGIKVVFVYNTINRKDDNRFIKMYAAYKHLLEKRGAAVEKRAEN